MSKNFRCGVVFTMALALIAPAEAARHAAAPKAVRTVKNDAVEGGEPSIQRGVVADRLEVPLRAGQSDRAAVVRMLPAGFPLAILAQNSRTKLSEVRLDSGEKGWLPSRYVIIESAGAERTKAAEKTPQELQAEIQRQASELIAVRQAAASALQIQNERDQLQASVIKLEREVESLRREKNAVDGDYRQDWFLIGAGVLLGGILLGMYLPRLRWRKKTSWDTF